jgi:parallel beta-helix repeat protein
VIPQLGRLARGWRSLAAAAGAAALVAGVTSLGPVALASPSTLYVSPTGSDTGACAEAAPCATIGHAVAVAAPGDTIVVGPGTYDEQVVITEPLTLMGQGLPVIDAAGQQNGILVKGAGAAGTVISGFEVEGAQMEGILLLSSTDVTVRASLIVNNDLGAFAPKPVGECAAQGVVPGDCGEGLHLMGTTDSTITGNLVAGNQGGILLSDETGPAAGNLISGNEVVDNLYDCGITLAGHNPAAFVKGHLQASSAGVYDNTISGNVSSGNGTKTGGGAGVVLAGGPPGTAVYDNLISENTLTRNGMPGVVLHSHAPFQYFNGNRIIDNFIEENGMDGGANGGPGDVDDGLAATAGIDLFSAVTPLQGTVIEGNFIRGEQIGVWTLHVAPGSVKTNDIGASVPVPVVAH